MSFQQVYDQYNWEEIKQSIYTANEGDVISALSKKTKLDLHDFIALISPAAQPYLEDMAKLSHQITKKRFGNTIQMYIPLYLSNACNNICTYCGFSYHNKIERLTLSIDQILKELEVIKSYGYDHILLVTGESSKKAGLEYFEKILKLIRPYFSHISMEVQPMAQQEYERLIPLGLNSVLVYQETYNKNNYKKYHTKGKKANFYHRLDIPDRLGKAGIHKIGLGTLIGLEDWRTDAFFTALHLNYLEKQYWKTKYTISFPRLRAAVGYDLPDNIVQDHDIVQLICAYRIFNENVELSLSTRERQKFRKHLIPLGITTVSAGSKTDPGGYALKKTALRQFSISDEQSPHQVAVMIRQQGYEPVWKDWDAIYK